MNSLNADQAAQLLYDAPSTLCGVLIISLD
jgi:hypothetical protein